MLSFNLKKPDEARAFDQFLKNRRLDFSQFEEKVEPILRAVRQEGDKALVQFTRRFDGVKLKPSEIEISPLELKKGFSSVSPAFIRAVELAKKNIAEFYSQTKRFSWELSLMPGSQVGETIRPLDSVGVYVPGGTAPLVSTILMTVVPAKVAGVRRIVAVTPPGKSGKLPNEMLAAFYITEVDRVFRIGGAQAIAALAYGTETVPRVDKIVGPGNPFVTAAKKLVFGDVGIDTLAGPSEVLIVADRTAVPAYLAADMLSQLEHDVESKAVLVSAEAAVLEKTQKELEKQAKKLKRQRQLGESIKRGAVFLEVESLSAAIEVANRFSPEHCELAVDQPEKWAKEIRHAGALFLGNYSPVATGDFVAGPSHVLPTGGAARFSSGLSLDDFVKKNSVISFSHEALWGCREALEEFTRVEGLDAHAASVQVRFQTEGIKKHEKKSR